MTDLKDFEPMVITD